MFLSAKNVERIETQVKLAPTDDLCERVGGRGKSRPGSEASALLPARAHATVLFGFNASIAQR